MPSGSPPDPSWDQMLVLALSVEAAFLAENWIEFEQLCGQRSSTLRQLKAAGVAPDQRIVPKIEETDARVVKAIQERRREVSNNLRKLAQFRKSLMPA